MPSHGGSPQSYTLGGDPTESRSDERITTRFKLREPRAMPDGPRVTPNEDVPSTSGPLSLLKTSWNAVMAVKGRLFLLIILSNLVLTALAFPLAHWVFREALRADGMYAIDMDDFAIAPGFPITVLLLAIALLIVLLALVVEFAAILLLLHDPALTFMPRLCTQSSMPHLYTQCLTYAYIHLCLTYAYIHLCLTKPHIHQCLIYAQQNPFKRLPLSIAFQQRFVQFPVV